MQIKLVTHVALYKNNPSYARRSTYYEYLATRAKVDSDEMKWKKYLRIR